MEIEEMIWNNFSYSHFFQFSTNYELFKGFWVKFELTEICSNRLNVITIANPSELKFGQEVLHGGIKYLHYDLIDMHNPSPKIKEVRESQI
jgi:hypothetical protein